MLQSIGIGEIKVRAEAVNLSLKRLAKLAKADPSTVYRAARGEGDVRLQTQRKLLNALQGEEQRLLAHLSALHGEARAA